MVKYILTLLLVLTCAISAQAESFYINNLGGGLNTKTSPLVLKDNESGDCLNVFFDVSGSLNKRRGQDVLLTPSTGTTADIDGLYSFKKDSGTQYLMVISGGEVYKMDSLDGVLDSIKTGTSQTSSYLDRDWETRLYLL